MGWVIAWALARRRERTIVDITVDDLARRVEQQPDVDYLALVFENVFSPSLGAAVLERISLDKAVAIVDSRYLSTSKAAAILNDTNISASKAAAILEYISLDKAAAILNDTTNLSDGRVADILNSGNLSPSRIRDILSNTNMSADNAQRRLYAMADKLYLDRLIELFTFDAPDETISSSTTVSDGVVRRRRLTIESGVTLKLGAGPGLVLADTVENYGSIVSAWVKGGGGGGAGYGGSGAGGVVILARYMVVGTVRSDGGYCTGCDCASTKTGGGGGSGLFWCVGSDAPPKGGDGGADDPAYAGAGGHSGGGGGVSGYKGGDGGEASVVTFSTAQELLVELFKAVIDWWLVNVVGRTPSATKSIPYLGGGGGGGGASKENQVCGGGGGGGGGQVIMYAANIEAGTVTARGYKGCPGSAVSDGAEVTGKGSGGGGGGGGIIYVFYKNKSGDFTFDVSGGSGGAGDYPGGAGGDGIAREFQI